MVSSFWAVKNLTTDKFVFTPMFRTKREAVAYIVKELNDPDQINHQAQKRTMV